MRFIVIHYVIVGWILLLLYLCGGNAMFDSRCYLEGGGSAESFNASEDLTIGSVIGYLSILGDPRAVEGNITLDLRERDAAVVIKPGTKEIILADQLDREGKNGLNSIYVNVICKRRYSSDTSFVIPVNVHVTDVNDNAPKWIGAPYHLTLSEVTVPDTRILQGVRAIDDDSDGPYSEIQYRVLNGEYSDYVSFISPSDGTLLLRKALDFETLKNFSVKLRAQDRGEPPKYSDTNLFVQVTDADDQNPKFLRDSYSGEIPAVGGGDRVTIKPESIRATDQDEGIRAIITYSLTSSVGSEHFSIDSQSAAIRVKKSFYESGLDVVTLVVRATQADNSDRYSLATIVLISKNPSIKSSTFEKLESIPSKIKIRTREDTSIGTVLLTLSINKSYQPITYAINDNRESHYFRINSMGEIILNKQLDYEETKLHKFQIVAIDNDRNTTADIEIEVIDVNEWEPRFRQTSYEFSLPKQFNLTKAIPLGKLEAADGDQNDKISINIHGDLAEHFHIDAENRLWMNPMAPNITIMHLLATVTDNGSPSKNSTVPITITNNAIERIESSWAGNILKAFIFVFMLFLMIIASMCIHIYKKNERQPIDSRQSPSTLTINSKYVKNDVAIDQARNFLDLKCANYQQTTTAHLMNVQQKSDTIGSGSSISAGASTILAATLEREAQRDRDMENYTATVRSIISRASAAGNLYDDDFEHDSISNCGSKKHEWNLPNDNNIVAVVSNHMSLNPQIIKQSSSADVLNTDNAMYF